MGLLQVLGLSPARNRPAVASDEFPAVRARFDAIAAVVREAIVVAPERGSELLAALTTVQTLLRTGRDAEAATRIAELASTLMGGSNAAVPGSPAQQAGDLAAVLAAWHAARAVATTQLHNLSDAIRATGDPDGAPLIVLLQAIGKNLTPNPSTRQQAVELERYLVTDRIIDDAASPNPFGVEIDLRAALRPAAEQLKAALPG